MKIRILDRILVFLAGIVLFACGASAIAWRFLPASALQTVSDFIMGQDSTLTLILCGVGAMLVLLGIYCMVCFPSQEGASAALWCSAPMAAN